VVFILGKWFLNINLCIYFCYLNINKMEEPKLFPDSETFTKERPLKITDEQLQNFYKKIATEITENGWSKSPIESIAQDLSNVNLSQMVNGYEIAKELEQEGSYTFEMDFLEYLDNLPYEKESIREMNVKDWVKAHNPQHKFSLGDKLEIKTMLNYEKKAGEIIYINGFREDSAHYIVDKDKNRQGGTLITYEKLESNCIKID